ncbi:hypothetical protein [Melittangium boletus]|uniref:hypothetical protein n=1 Tax=Melittangium boletus TaxID=83453 RepID=UPI003DA579AE
MKGSLSGNEWKTRTGPLSRLVGGVVALWMAALPASAHAQELEAIEGHVANPCSSCLTSATGTSIIHYKWTASGASSTPDASTPAPSNALVRGVYVIPVSSNGVTVTRAELNRNGWTDDIIKLINGGYTYPTYQLPNPTWNNQLVVGDPWTILPIFSILSPGYELKLDLGIKWEVPPAPPPPPPPSTKPVGQFEFMGLRGNVRSYAYDPNNHGRTVVGRITWSPAYASGGTEGFVSYSVARPSLNVSLGIQGDHAYDYTGEPPVDSPIADGVTRTFRMYATSSDDKETLLPGSPKTRCYLLNADRTSIVPCDGTLVRRADGRLYVIAGGAPFLFANDAEAQSLGYSLSNILPDTEGFYTLAANWRMRDGTLARFGSSPARYVAAGGGLFWASSPARWNSYLSAVGKSDTQVMRLPQSYMPKSVPAPTAGVVVQELGKTAFWVYQGGGRFWVPGPTSWAAYGQATGMTDVRLIPEGSLSNVAVEVNGVDQAWPRDDLSPRDGTAVYEVGKGNIWVYQGGGRFWAHSPESWAAYGQATGITTARPLPAGALSSLLVEVNGVDQVQPREDLSPRDGTAVYEVGKTAFWVYQGGGRFWATDSSSWAAYGQATGITQTRPIPFGALSVVIGEDSSGNPQVQPRGDTRPRDGTLVREVNNTGVFVYQGGGNFVFPSQAEFDLWPGPRSVRLIPDGSLSGQMVGDTNFQDTYQTRDDLPVDGTLLRERTGTQVYQVSGQLKSPATGYNPAHVKLVPDNSIQRVPNG